jgi:hypothetical protein
MSSGVCRPFTGILRCAGDPMPQGNIRDPSRKEAGRVNAECPARDEERMSVQRSLDVGVVERVTTRRENAA